MPVKHLKKFIRAKFNLTASQEVFILIPNIAKYRKCISKRPDCHFSDDKHAMTDNSTDIAAHLAPSLSGPQEKLSSNVNSQNKCGENVNDRKICGENVNSLNKCDENVNDRNKCDKIVNSLNKCDENVNGRNKCDEDVNSLNNCDEKNVFSVSGDSAIRTEKSSLASCPGLLLQDSETLRDVAFMLYWEKVSEFCIKFFTFTEIL